METRPTTLYAQIEPELHRAVEHLVLDRGPGPSAGRGRPGAQRGRRAALAVHPQAPGSVRPVQLRAARLGWRETAAAPRTQRTTTSETGGSSFSSIPEARRRQDAGVKRAT